LRFGANPNAVDENGDNALIYLLHYGNYYYPTGQYLRNINVYKTVEKLLKGKIDPNTITNVDGGVSALIEAARFNADADVCSLLLNYGANPKQRMPDGSTLFDAKYPKSMHDGMGTVLTEWTRLKNINWNLTENKSENMMKTSKLHIRLPLDVRERIRSYIFKKQPPSQI
jgi:ankyrin repeat protein